MVSDAYLAASLLTVPGDAAPLVLVPVMLWAVVLCYYDLRWHRLPDTLTLSAGAGALLAAVNTSVSYCWGAALWAGTYLLVALAMGSQGESCRDTTAASVPVGGGDIKLAIPLGIGTCAAGGLWAVIFAMAGAQVFMLIVFSLRHRRSKSASVPMQPTGVRRMAHGPAMLLAALVSVLLTGSG